MQTLWEYLNAPSVGTLLGVIGVALAVVFYRRGKTVTSMAHQGCAATLIGERDAELPSTVTVAFKGVDVPRVTKSILVFWNSGNTTIEGASIVPADPLRIEVGGAMLDASVIKTSRGVVGVTLELDPDRPNAALLTFAFLDPNDGARVELLHTGPVGSAKFAGTVKGVPRGCPFIGMIPPADRPFSDTGSRSAYVYWARRQPRTVGTITMIVGLSVIAMAGFPKIVVALMPWLPSVVRIPSLNSGKVEWGMLIFGILYLLLAATLLPLRARYPRVLEQGKPSERPVVT